MWTLGESDETVGNGGILYLPRCSDNYLNV